MLGKTSSYRYNKAGINQSQNSATKESHRTNTFRRLNEPVLLACIEQPIFRRIPRNSQSAIYFRVTPSGGERTVNIRQKCSGAVSQYKPHFDPRERWRLGQSLNNVQMMRQWHRALRWIHRRARQKSTKCRAIRACRSMRWTVTVARKRATSRPARSNPRWIRQVLSPAAHYPEMNVSNFARKCNIFFTPFFECFRKLCLQSANIDLSANMNEFETFASHENSAFMAESMRIAQACG